LFIYIYIYHHQAPPADLWTRRSSELVSAPDQSLGLLGITGDKSSMKTEVLMGKTWKNIRKYGKTWKNWGNIRTHQAKYENIIEHHR